MSNVGEIIYLPVAYIDEPIILAYCVGYDNVYIQGKDNNLAVVTVGFSGDKFKNIVPVSGYITAVCMRPGYTSDAFSAYQAYSPVRLEYDRLASEKFTPLKTIAIPNEFGINYNIACITWDEHNKEVYYCLGGGNDFSSFVIIDSETRIYKRKIDLSALNFNVIDVSHPAVSRLRKIFVSNGIHSLTPQDRTTIFCINDQDDVVIDHIEVPDIEGIPVDYISGTLVDNIRDILYVVCVAESHTGFQVNSVVYAFDIKSYELLASSRVHYETLRLPVLDIEKRILYLISSQPSPPTPSGVGLPDHLISLDLETMNFINSVLLPESDTLSMVHLARSGRVGITSTTSDGDNPRPIFYIVDKPEVP